jgi:hypothetical protein
MKHIAFVSCRRERPIAAHTPEEISKFITGLLELMGSAVGVLSGIEELRQLKEGTAT